MTLRFATFIERIVRVNPRASAYNFLQRKAISVMVNKHRALPLYFFNLHPKPYLVFFSLHIKPYVQREKNPVIFLTK